jgi:hypothetical protein
MISELIWSLAWKNELPSYRRPSYSGITITSGVYEMSLPSYRRPSCNSITITSGMEDFFFQWLDSPLWA